MSNNVPWESACYTQALTAKILLDWYQIESTTYLGVWKDEAANTIKGHAWVKVGNLIITGRKGHKKYKVLTWY